MSSVIEKVLNAKVPQFSKVALAFFAKLRSLNSTAFDQTWCKDAAKIRGLPFELLAERGGFYE